MDHSVNSSVRKREDSSIEVQADSSDYGFDLDIDLPIPSFPLSCNGQVANGSENSDAAESATAAPANFFAMPVVEDAADNVKSEKAVAGICGFQNFANTCYMNSGLQCLLATPTVVKYFTEICLDANLKSDHSALTRHFGPLLKDVWAGEYSILKPVLLKETLACAYPQFHGSQQHDCQEFLALLLDTMHEELKLAQHPECATVSRLHSHANQAINSMALPESMVAVAVVETSSPGTSPVVSPKSYDSLSSSIDDKVAATIRYRPLPKDIKGVKFSGNIKPMDLNLISSAAVSSDCATISRESTVTCQNTGRGERQGDHLGEEALIPNGGTPSLVGDAHLSNGISSDARGQQLSFFESPSEAAHVDCKQDRNPSYHFNIKRMRLDSSDNEPERGCPRQADTDKVKEAVDADLFWNKYLAANDTVVARSFQGQFKNTVVCSVCHYVSVSFEPFRYLPLCLPNAHIQQLQVTVVRAHEQPSSLLLNLTYADTVMNVKEQVLLALKHSQMDSTSRLVLAEVADHCVCRAVEDWVPIQHLRTEDRSVYVMEVINQICNGKSDSHEQENQAGPLPLVQGCVSRREASLIAWSCLRCRQGGGEENSSLMRHSACGGIICDSCLEATIELQSEQGMEQLDESCAKRMAEGLISCPYCAQEVDPSSDFVRVQELDGVAELKVAQLTLPVLHRVVSSSSCVTTFSHPSMIRVTDRCSGVAVFSLLSPFVRSERPFELVLVSADGKACSRCCPSSRCTGCLKIDPSDGDNQLTLMSSDCIAISFLADVITQKEIDWASQVVAHASLSDAPRLKSYLSLDDCLSAFSEREVLDESNPWYCPICERRQCATKTLTIWRFPDFLIIYLKRFVFINHSTGAVKLDKAVHFAVDDFDVTPFVSGPVQGSRRLLYQLYGCVSHFGSISGGHYTAFSRHLGTGQWNYFDDGCVTEGKAPAQNPEDFSSAYILFYRRSDGKTQKHERMCSVSTSTVTAAFCHLENIEEDMSGPDLTPIIRSLDTPPPSS